jgi:hypothetical protein
MIWLMVKSIYFSWVLKEIGGYYGLECRVFHIGFRTRVDGLYFLELSRYLSNPQQSPPQNVKAELLLVFKSLN